MKFEDKLKVLRERENLTQTQMAVELGLSESTIAALENGSIIPDIEVVLNISKKFGVTTDYLLKDEMAFGNSDKNVETEDSERAGKRLLAMVMGAIYLIILAFTPMFANSIQMKELATFGESLYSWKAYILRAPLVYIFVLAAVGLVSAIYLFIKNRKRRG